MLLLAGALLKFGDRREFVGRHYGGSDSFAFDITDFVGDGKEHSIVVHAESDLRSGTQPGGGA